MADVSMGHERQREVGVSARRSYNAFSKLITQFWQYHNSRQMPQCYREWTVCYNSSPMLQIPILNKIRSCVHRAKFLDELLRLIPGGIAEFNKKVIDLVQDQDGVTITFSDGTSARASSVIACDGIKSLCRKIILGKDSQQAEPVFAGEYAYRTLLNRDLANSILTPELAGNGNIYCGHGAYIITYPVDKGKLVNVVAIRRKDDVAWNREEWLAPCPREVMIKDFEDWGDPLRKLIAEITDIKQWALFDAPNASTFCSGRVCLAGDAAHASTPNQGAGAGMVRWPSQAPKF